jgi:photosystem II stability/assembly factor-like uncharacterized protein
MSDTNAIRYHLAAIKTGGGARYFGANVARANSPWLQLLGMKLAVMLLAGAAWAQSWVGQTSGTTASLRGVKVVNARVAWASGTRGTWLISTDGGATWRSGTVPGAEKLDFRGVWATDERNAWLMSVGSGSESRIYRTTDGGRQWRQQLAAPAPKGFFDGIAFWDARHGMVVGDPVDGEFEVYTTEDRGHHWRRQHTPEALPDEGAFAASNSCLTLRGAREAWFASGGPAGSRVFHSVDGGGSWTAARTPLRNDGASAGIFSLGFLDGLVGVAVGGDYSKPTAAAQNIAVTADGGLTWSTPAGAPGGYRSAVLYVPEYKAWVATGTSGSDISFDGGQTWQTFDTVGYNALGAADGTVLAVGPKGRIAKLRVK